VILSRFFWLFIGVLIGLLMLIPVLAIGGFLILLIMLITPYVIPLALIIIGGLLILLGLAILL
jgi:hypothetical protein